MIGTTRDFLVKFLQEHPISGKVLDVGSLNVNGHVKDILKDFEYVGLDMREGDNVDVVANAHKIPFEDDYFDFVICFDTLEHDDLFWLSLKEMRRVLKSGGWLMIGTPSINHAIHRHPCDYYRFTKDSFEQVFFLGMDNVLVEEQCYGDQNDDRPDQVFGWGQKP